VGVVTGRVCLFVCLFVRSLTYGHKHGCKNVFMFFIKVLKNMFFICFFLFFNVFVLFKCRVFVVVKTKNVLN